MDPWSLDLQRTCPQSSSFAAGTPRWELEKWTDHWHESWWLSHWGHRNLLGSLGYDMLKMVKDFQTSKNTRLPPRFSQVLPGQNRVILMIPRCKVSGHIFCCSAFIHSTWRHPSTESNFRLPPPPPKKIDSFHWSSNIECLRISSAKKVPKLFHSEGFFSYHGTFGYLQYNWRCPFVSFRSFPVCLVHHKHGTIQLPRHLRDCHVKPGQWLSTCSKTDPKRCSLPETPQFS